MWRTPTKIIHHSLQCLCLHVMFVCSFVSVLSVQCTDLIQACCDDFSAKNQMFQANCSAIVSAQRNHSNGLLCLFCVNCTICNGRIVVIIAVVLILFHLIRIYISKVIMKSSRLAQNAEYLGSCVQATILSKSAKFIAFEAFQDFVSGI